MKVSYLLILLLFVVACQDPKQKQEIAIAMKQLDSLSAKHDALYKLVQFHIGKADFTRDSISLNELRLVREKLASFKADLLYLPHNDHNHVNHEHHHHHEITLTATQLVSAVGTMDSTIKTIEIELIAIITSLQFP